MIVFIFFYKQSFVEDNNIRGNFSFVDYVKLRSAFDRKYGTVTAVNSTSLIDGAVAVILMIEFRAKELGLVSLGYLRSYVFIAIDVWQDMLFGSVWLISLALERVGLTMSDLILIDMYEVFVV